MNILLVNGSSREDSSNGRLLQSFSSIVSDHTYKASLPLHELPLFTDKDRPTGLPPNVLKWQKEVGQCDALIISTPEYIHNIPAILKNALEWLTASGELAGKPVLPITYTPHAPRGEKAMQSLLCSLQALDTKIVTSLQLYKNEISASKAGAIEGTVEIKNLLISAIQLL